MTVSKIALLLGSLLAMTSHGTIALPQSAQPIDKLAQKPPTGDLSPIISAFLVSPTGLTPITPQTTVRSGDLVEYHAYLPNHSPDRIRSMTITLEIPQGVTFAHKVSPAGATASVDNRNFAQIPLRTQVDGQLQNVPERFYRSLRWQIEDVGIHGVATVKYQAQIH